MTSNETYPEPIRSAFPQEKCVKVGPYLLMETIGIGTTSKVKVAVIQGSYKRFACKIMDKKHVRDTSNNPQVLKEIHAMRKLDHRNIVSFKSVLSSASKIYLIMELVEGIELFREIKTHERLSEPYARLFFTQLVEGLQHCHERGVYHRDLKPENLMITYEKVLKITDFGLSNLKVTGSSSMVSEHGSLLMKTQCGTPNYVAPEIITISNEDSPNSYSGSKVDIWACGIILFVLVSGQLPFDSPQTDVLFKSILLGHIAYPPYFSPSLVDLISNILETNPSQRYTLQEIRRHPWFNGPVEYSMSRYSGDFADDLALPPNISTAALQAQAASNSPRSVSNESLHDQYSQPALGPGHGHTRAREQGMKGLPQKQHAHLGPHFMPVTQRTADSLDFGLRVETEQLLPAVSAGNGSWAGDVTDPSSETTVAGPRDCERLPYAPMNPVDRFKSREKIGNSNSSFGSTVGEDQGSESEEAEEVHPPSISHARRADRSRVDSTRPPICMRRACSLENITGSPQRIQDSQEQVAFGDDEGYVVQYSMRGLVKRQLWDRAAELRVDEGLTAANQGTSASERGDLDAIRKSISIGADMYLAKGIRKHNPSARSDVSGGRLVRANSHDGVVTLPTRRKPRARVDRTSEGHSGSCAPVRVSDVEGSGRGDILKDSPRFKIPSRKMSEGGNDVTSKRRRGPVRFREGDGGTELRNSGFKPDNEWVESDSGKMLWCRMMKDYDMVPDDKEFDMDSCQLNQLWTTGLAKENLIHKASFSAKRFVLPSFTPSRSTQFLYASPVQAVTEGTNCVESTRLSMPISTRVPVRTVSPQGTVVSTRDGEAVTGDSDTQCSQSAAVVQTQKTALARGVDGSCIRRGGNAPDVQSPSGLNTLSAVPAHMVTEMMAASRGVRSRLSPNGRTSLGTQGPPTGHGAGLQSPSGHAKTPLRGLNGSPRIRLGEGGDLLPLHFARAPKQNEAGSEALVATAGTESSPAHGVGDRQARVSALGVRSGESDVTNASGSSKRNSTVPTVVSSSGGSDLQEIEPVHDAYSSGSKPMSPFTSGSIPMQAAVMGPVSPFQIDIPGPPVNAAPPSTKPSLASLLPSRKSVRRLFGKASDPLAVRRFTQFQSHLPPQKCYEVVRELLQGYGCSVVKGTRSRGRFSVNVRYKRAEEDIDVRATVVISKFDDVLSSVLFKKKGSTNDDHFFDFYTNVYEKYCKTPK